MTKALTKKICLVLCAGLMVVNFSGCYFYPKEDDVLAPPLIEAPKVVYETTKAKKSNLEKKITVTGSFVSVSQENLAFKYRGGILKLLDVKIGDKVKKGSVLAELDTDSLESQLKLQEIAVKMSELDYESTKAKADVDTYELQKAELTVQSAKIRLEDMKREYNKAKLAATSSGVIVYVDNVNIGDAVAANKTLITVADPLQLQLQYIGDKSAEFQVGKKVKVNCSGKEYEGEVVMSPSNIPSDVNSSLKNAVNIKVKSLSKEVSIGESAEISLIIESRENVIVLPRSVINNYNGRNYVQVLENGAKLERDVELGVQTATEVEIVKGLEEGEEVIQR